MKGKNILLGLLLLGGLSIGCKEKPERREVKTPAIEFKKEAEIYLTRPSGDTIQQLEVELADDEYQRETGLMYRESLEESQGMLFIFEEEKERGFYMKNTYIPLDLIFLDGNNKIVSIQENAEPHSEKTIPSEASAQYVLEINAGLVNEWNLQVGDSLILNRD